LTTAQTKDLIKDNAMYAIVLLYAYLDNSTNESAVDKTQYPSVKTPSLDPFLLLPPWVKGNLRLMI
jgi:hypothetical protein